MSHLATHSMEALRLWIVTVGCLGGGGSLGATVFSYDPEQSPEIQNVGYWFSNADKGMALGTYGGDLYVGDKANLRRFSLVAIPYGQQSSTIVASPPDALVRSFTGFSISFLCEFDGRLYVGLDAGAGASKIVSYDGLSFKDDITGIDAPVSAALWRDFMVVGFAAASGHIRYRAVGASPGTWTTVAAGGVATCPGNNSMLSYHDKLYLVDGVQTIWSYDGSALTAVRVIATAGVPTGTVEGVCALAVLGGQQAGQMFYAYNLAANTGALVGKFDDSGSAIQWTDAHKDLTAQFSNLKYVRNLVSYRSVLVAAFRSAGAATSLGLASSPGLNTAGTWDGTNPGSTGALFQPVQLLVA